MITLAFGYLWIQVLYAKITCDKAMLNRRDVIEQAGMVSDYLLYSPSDSCFTLNCVPIANVYKLLGFPVYL